MLARFTLDFTSGFLDVFSCAFNRVAASNGRRSTDNGQHGEQSHKKFIDHGKSLWKIVELEVGAQKQEVSLHHRISFGADNTEFSVRCLT